MKIKLLLILLATALAAVVGRGTNTILGSQIGELGSVAVTTVLICLILGFEKPRIVSVWAYASASAVAAWLSVRFWLKDAALPEFLDSGVLI